MLIRENNLKNVHPDLVKVVNLAWTYLKTDIVVIEGARTAAKAAENLAKGLSQTKRSRHVPANNKSGMAEAVDMAPILGKSIPWKRYDLFLDMDNAMQKAAKVLSIAVDWGGAWKTFKDLDHWELSKKK